MKYSALPRCCRFFVSPRREEEGYAQRSVTDEQRGRGRTKRRNPEGESALGRLAALLALHPATAGTDMLVARGLAIQPKTLSRGVAEYFKRLLRILFVIRGKTRFGMRVRVLAGAAFSP